MSQLQELKQQGEAPSWLTEHGLSTLVEGYLLPGETPRMMYRRVANSAAAYLEQSKLADKFYDYIDKNWLCLATPVASNLGTSRGLPISCYGQFVGDSVWDIFNSVVEGAMLLKHGGGLGTCWSGIRERGTPIAGNGESGGLIPWIKNHEAMLDSTAQGGVRRGSGAEYFPIRSLDREELIDIRRDTGDLTRRCLSSSFHHAALIPDDFMDGCARGSADDRKTWRQLLTARFDKGEPYITWIDTANRNVPECYKYYGLDIKSSQLCNEIYLYSDVDHTYVCCLSSVNLARYDEWKYSDLVETATWFLDGVMSEFIDKAKDKPGFGKAVAFAVKSRALGIGVVGWHTLLQSKMIPFESFAAMQLNNEVFSNLDERSLKASQDLATVYGEVEWTKGFGIRNTHRIALAPTKSNAMISGGVSQGIEPIEQNFYADNTAKGTFIRKNKQLETLLESKEQNTFDVWQQINMDKGSVKNVKCLTDHEKSVFATAREINQFAIVQQAGQRQKYIDQGQSVNLFFSVPKTADSVLRRKMSEYINKVHLEAYKLGLKGLYYLHAEAILSGDSVYSDGSSCKSCEA